MGKNLTSTLGAEESFSWQLLNGKPFAFILKEGQVHAWYEGKIYPLGYEKIVHDQCCEAGMFNIGHNEKMLWFYAYRQGNWRYVEMGLE